jgi:serine/threonine-protein kinase
MSQPHVGTMRYEAGETVNDKYEILETLGHGGMSDAYKARELDGGRLVVLKVPYLSLIGDPATYSRYQRELEIGKRLHHPNIQGLLDEGRLDDGVAPYLVLEFVDGTLLREHLRQNAPLPVDEAIRIAVQLADALEYCHQHGVVHRDLKPENILMEADGTVKLVDFGIALLQGARRLTFRRLSTEVGTPDYMAPEQVEGERGDARTDIYALGIMLYEMLTGEVPYHGDSPLAVMSQRVTTDAPLLRQKRTDAPPALQAIVWRAVRRDPNERYASMSALREDLLHPEQVEIPSTYPSDSAQRPRVSREHLVSAAIIVCVFLVLAAIGVFAQMAHTAKGPT